MSVKYSFPATLHLSRECLDLISRIFVANPAQRISIAQIKQHPWFLRNLPDELKVGLVLVCVLGGARCLSPALLAVPIQKGGRLGGCSGAGGGSLAKAKACMCPRCGCHARDEQEQRRGAAPPAPLVAALPLLPRLLPTPPPPCYFTQDGGIAMKEACPTPSQTVDSIRRIVGEARTKAQAPPVRAGQPARAAVEGCVAPAACTRCLCQPSLPSSSA